MTESSFKKDNPEIPEVFKEFFKKTNVLAKLDEPREEEKQLSASLDSLPVNTPEWVKDLIALEKKDPKRYQLVLMINDLTARCERGSLLSPGDTPKKWIEEADKLDDKDFMKKWKLRQAATEYLVKAAGGEEPASVEAKLLLRRILEDDRMVEEFYPQLIKLVKTTPSGPR